jgi:hypothetical protein
MDELFREAVVAVGDLIGTVTDPNDRIAAVTDRAVEWVRADFHSRGVPLDDVRFRAFVEGRLPGLRYEIHRTCTGAPAEAPPERLLLRLWEELAAFLSEPCLAEADRARLESFLDTAGEQHQRRYTELLVEVVRSSLRKRASCVGATASAVAQSVWQSFLADHLHEVDLDDPDSAWNLLVRIAVRHINKWDQRGRGARVGGRRVRSVSLDEPVPSPHEGTPQTFAESFADPRQLPPVDEAILREYQSILSEPGEAVDGPLGLGTTFTPREREVFALKIALRSRPEIASLMNISVAQVDRAWQGIQLKARRLLAEAV